MLQFNLLVLSVSNLIFGARKVRIADNSAKNTNFGILDMLGHHFPLRKYKL